MHSNAFDRMFFEASRQISVSLQKPPAVSILFKSVYLPKTFECKASIMLLFISERFLGEGYNGW